MAGRLQRHRDSVAAPHCGQSCEQTGGQRGGRGGQGSTYRPRSVSSLLMRLRAMACEGVSASGERAWCGAVRCGVCGRRGVRVGVGRGCLKKRSGLWLQES